MRHIVLTIGTALLGLTLSFILPQQTGSKIARFLTAPDPGEYQSSVTYSVSPADVSLGSVNGFGKLLPTPTATGESEKYRQYQQKVQMLLSQLEEATDNRSSYHTIAFNDSLLTDSDTSPQPGQTGYQSVLTEIPTDVEPTTNNTGELQENPNDRIRRIVLLGDSMIDTLGRDLPYLRSMLETKYPDKVFALYNYGHGATDLDQGCTRLTQETNYLNTRYPPILSIKPEIIVLESFAYNHWSSASYDLDRQWITLARCIDTIKKESPKTHIILAATIAPNAKFPSDALRNLTNENQQEWVQTTHAYLQNLLRFAQSEKYPVADAYTPSLDAGGNGQSQFIDVTDHLHPSEAGKRLFSEKILETIEQNRLIK